MFLFVRMCLIASEHVFCVLIKVWYIDKRVFFVSVRMFSFTEGLLCMLMRVYYVGWQYCVLYVIESAGFFE